MENCYKVKDDGMGNGIIFVEVNSDKILHGDFYLYIKNNKPCSIELCDSEILSKEVSKSKYKKGKEVYNKIVKSSRKLHGGYIVYNHSIIIDEINML